MLLLNLRSFTASGFSFCVKIPAQIAGDGFPVTWEAKRLPYNPYCTISYLREIRPPLSNSHCRPDYTLRCCVQSYSVVHRPWYFTGANIWFSSCNPAFVWYTLLIGDKI